MLVPVQSTNSSAERALFLDMVLMPGGIFRMGSDRHYPEEAPASRRGSIFWIDRTPVTNRQFRKFVNETGHVTLAELPPDAKDYPGALPEMLKAGSLIFASPRGPVDLRDWSQWWQFKFGANWRRPYGPRSSISGLDDHPVVHIAYRDAEAYAQWAGKALADRSRMGICGARRTGRRRICLGRRIHAGRQTQANTWQGEFPAQNLAIDGYERTSPVTAFPPNGYGLHDMIGNVWEWTTDWFAPQRERERTKPCCAPDNPRGAAEETSYDPRLPNIKIPRKVLKGGSHLCAPNYCRRYRPAARHAQPVDTSTSHIGFRCVIRTGSETCPTTPRERSQA